MTLSTSGLDTRRPTPAAMERRADPRFALRAHGLVADAQGTYDCIVADLSLGGCALEGDLPLRHGSEIAIGFDLLIGLVGTVVHAGDGFYGVRFDETAGRRDEIRRWMVRRLKAVRAQAKQP